MKRTALFISLIVLLFAVIPPAMAADPVGTVTFVTGNVDITRPGSAAIPLQNGDDVYVGDIVRTKTGAKAEIRFIDESIVRLAQKSRVEITEYMVKKDEQRSRLSLWRGKIQSLVKKVAGRSWGRNKRHRFLIQTPTAVCGVRGTDFFAWYTNGETWTVFQEGSGEMWPVGNETLVQTINTGKTGFVPDALSPPVVRDTDPNTLEPLRQDTVPTKEEVAAIEAEVNVVQGAVLAAVDNTVDPGATNDIVKQGTVYTVNPPLTISEGAQTAAVDTAISEDLKVAALADLLGDTTLVESDPFELTGSAFLSGATLEGFVVEPEGGEQEGEFSLSGTLGPGYGASMVIAESDWLQSGDPPPSPITIMGVKGGLTTVDDAQAGAFAGQLGGVSGTWRGLFFSIYAQRPSPVGELYNAGFLYGDPASSQDPSAIREGGEFSAGGSLIRSDVLGQVQLPAPGAPATLADQLYGQFDSDALSYVPSLADVTVGPWIQEGIHSQNADEDGLNRLMLTNDQLLEVWLEPHSGAYMNPGGESSWQSHYGQTDGSNTYFMLGLVSGSDDTNGHVSISGNPRYLDNAYFGEILVEHRGTYFPDDDDSFPYNSVTSGAIIKTPLAYSGDWGVDTIYENSDGVMTSVANEWGILGGRTSPFDSATSELIAYGVYDDNFGEGHYLWNSWLDGNKIIENDPLTYDDDFEIEGYSAGFWRSGSPAGSIQGGAIAIYKDSSGNAGLLGSNDINGSYYPGLLQWSASGTWRQDPRESGLSSDYNIDSRSITSAPFAGGFSGGGAISGFHKEGETRFLAISEDSLPWGIYDLKLGHPERPNLYQKPLSGGNLFSGTLGGTGSFDIGESGYWLTEVEGTWQGNGDIVGTMSGIYLTPLQTGRLGGPVTGLFEQESVSAGVGYGNWVGQSIGLFEGSQLDFSGSVQGMNWFGDLDLFMASENLSINALMGAVSGGNFDLTFLGEHLVNTPFWPMMVSDKVNDTDNKYLILIDMGPDSNSLSGVAVGLYIEKTEGYSGFVDIGGISGSHYPGNGLWDAEAVLNLRGNHEDSVGENSGFLSTSIKDDLTSSPRVSLSGTEEDFYGGLRLTTYYPNSDDGIGVFRMLQSGFQEPPEADEAWLLSAIGEQEPNEYGYGGYAGYARLYYLNDTAMGWTEGTVTAENGFYPNPYGTWTLVPDTRTDFTIGGTMMWGAEPEGGGSLLYYSDPASPVGNDWGLAGVAPLEGTAYQFLAIGRYTEPNGLSAGKEYLWATELFDVFGTVQKTVGYTGGIWRGGDMLGKVFGLFDNPSSDAGILFGDLTGNFFETDYTASPVSPLLNYEGSWITIGETEYVAMSPASPDSMFIPYEIEDFALTGSGSGSGTTTTAVSAIDGSTLGYNRVAEGESVHEEPWGVFGASGYGTYSGDPGIDSNRVFHDWRMYLESTPKATMWIEAHGTDAPQTTLVGKSHGAWVSISDATTGILAGEVLGTFDPAASKWQAVMAGSWVETAKFFDMLATNKAALEQLNIPSVEIGRANLAQVGDDGAGLIENAYLNNVVFFDHARGGVQPSIFATDQVGGNYRGTPGQGNYVNFEGNGLAARMTLDSFNPGGNWAGYVRGGGDYSGTGSMDGQSIWMQGGAAGTVGTSDFTGTAAGVAGTGGVGANPYTDPAPPPPMTTTVSP